MTAEPIQEYMGHTSRQKGLVTLLIGGQSLGICQQALLNCVHMYNIKEDSDKRGCNVRCLFILLSGNARLDPRNSNMPSKHSTSSCVLDSNFCKLSPITAVIFLKYLGDLTGI